MARYSSDDEKDEREEEEEKQDQPEAKEPEPAPTPVSEPETMQEQEPPQARAASLQQAQEKQAPGTTLEQTDTGVRASSGPTNRQTPGMYDLMSHKAYKDASVQLVNAGALDQLPEILQDDAQALSEKNARGEMTPNASHNWSSQGNDIRLDYSSIRDNKHAAYFAMNLFDDKQKYKFFKEYAELNKLDLDTVLYEAETMLGDRLFDMPQSAKGQLKYAGIYDLSGNELDLDTANEAQVAQAIRMIPPGEEHDMAVKAFKKLYGWTDDASLDFMEIGRAHV